MNTQEYVLLGVCVLLGLVWAAIAEATGVSALKWLGMGMVVAGVIAIAATRRW